MIDLLVNEGIGTLAIGQNPTWKQGIHLETRTNENFVSIPHARFVSMLTYKAELVGIQVSVTAESYTSKASFLDGDPLPVYTAGETRAVTGASGSSGDSTARRMDARSTPMSTVRTGSFAK